MLRVYTDSKYCIQRTLLRNRLVITNKKKSYKTKTQNLYASKEENEEMSKSKTKMSTWMYLQHVIADVKIA